MIRFFQVQENIVLRDERQRVAASRKGEFFETPVKREMNILGKSDLLRMEYKKDNLTQYGFDIYFYTTLGLFIDNNFDKTKISELGCSGDYIQSVIESHNMKN